jgi:hypothetical protein
MKFALAVLVLCSALSAQNVFIPVDKGETATLPEAPSVLCSRSPAVCDSRYAVAPPPKAGFWSFRAPDDPVLRSNHEVFHDKTLLATQAFWLGAITYDVELTHQGLAHHNCVEHGDDPHPSRSELYVGNLPEYLVGSGFNYISMRYFGKPNIFLFATWGSVEHLRGGSAWITNCW